MSGENYNPNSIDAVLSRIESTLKQHVEDTSTYRKSLDANLKSHGERISELENCRTKAIGFAAGAGATGGAVGAWLHKFFGN
jgi:hypothetical protein